MGRGRSSESMVGNTYGKTHGMHNTPEYRTWTGMKERCYNPSADSYKNYGGRGITVCDRWRDDFPAFYADMGPRPSENHSLDRRDTDGNYEPENCRWATRSEQQKNKRPMQRKTHCKRGHEFAVVGTYVVGTRRTGRTCAQCAKDRARAREQRMKSI
jgi:hypothetical protein